MTNGRIVFSAGNPWPEGQSIDTAELSGRLRHGDQLDILFSVGTKRHGTSIDSATRRVRLDDDLDPVGGIEAPRNKLWGSREVWLNAGDFELSGVLLSSAEQTPLDIANICGREFTFDKLPEARPQVVDDRARFMAYCLAHDPVAHVWVRFDPSLASDGRLWTDFSGRLMVGGDDDFYRGFYGRARVEPLARIEVPETYSDARARSLLKHLLVQAEQFSLTQTSRGRRVFELVSE